MLSGDSRMEIKCNCPISNNPWLVWNAGFREGCVCCFLWYTEGFWYNPSSCIHAKVTAHRTKQIYPTLGSYLTNREEQVLINGATSDSLPVISGVPQGLVLGPLLFLIYIDGITSTLLSNGSKMTLYADDMLLYRHIETPQDPDYQKLQNDINSIVEWVYICFNVSKCKSMLISRKRNPL